MAANDSPNANAAGHVQRAVEQFVELCAAGAPPDPVAFAANYPAEARARITAQCRNYLEFDGLVGAQTGKSLGKPDSAKVRTFGDYRIEEELGRGGMGVVYLATQQSLNRRVALKVMASGLTLSKRHVERFRREATAAAQLRHPGIVPVHEFTEVDGTFAFAMDYIAGRNLGDILDDLRLANSGSGGSVEGTLGLQPEHGYTAECALLCAHVASALAAAHQQGITHRDIKPRNLMIDERRQVRLLDFGLAKSEDQGSISISGEITGTAHYMSPEQTLAKRAGLDHRTDIFSLGVILYELLTLRRPFDGKNLQQIVYQICFQEPPAIQQINPKVPRDLVTICQKALEKAPEARYQTAQEFEADLQRFLRWEPIHAKPAGLVSRAAKWIQRHRTESAAVVLLAVTGLTFASVAWVQAQQQRAKGYSLLAQALERDQAKDFATAEQLATSALEASPTEETRSKLELIRKNRELAATDQERRTAEANLLLARSSSLLGSNRELALRAALDAVDLVDSPDARSAVLEALGAGYRITQLGDGSPAVQACWSTDGALVATAPVDGPATTWDAASGAERFRLDGKHGPALALAFHPDGQRLATGERLADPAQPGIASICTVADGREQLRLPHIGPVESVQFDERGERLLTVSYRDYQHGPFHARVFDATTGKALGSVTDHARFIVAARISKNGRIVASNGDPGFVRIWDATTGAEFARLPSSRVRDLDFAPDSASLAVADSEGLVRVFSVPKGELLAENRHAKAVHTVRFDRTSTRLLTASADQTARLWTIDPTAHRLAESQVLIGHGNEVASAAFDTEGQRAVTACHDSVVRVFDLASGDELQRFEFGQRIDAATFDGSGRRVLVRTVDGRVSVWDLDGSRATVTLRQRSFARAVCFTSDGQQLVTGDDDGHAVVFNARDGQSIPRTLPKLDASVRAVDVDPKSRRVLMATESGEVAFYNLQNGARVGSLVGHQKNVHTARFASDGERVVTASDDGTAAVFDARDASLLCRIDLGAPACAAALSPDGTRLATLTQGAMAATVWSVPEGKRIADIGRASESWCALVFAVDGQSLVLAGNGHKVQRYSLAGELQQSFDVDVNIGSAALDRSGKKLLLCSQDPQTPVAQVFDLDSGKLLVRCSSHRGTLLGGTLSPDGTHAMTTAKDRTVLVWPTDPVATARTLPPREFSPADRRKLSLPPLRSAPPK